MAYYQINNYITQRPLFEGHFHSFKGCLEQAISDGISLQHADLSNQNLACANLDGAIITHSTFSGSNLTGANLSEADLQHSTFHNCALYNVCLSYSNISNCDFRGALFGGTLVNDTTMQKAKFSTLSCFDLDFGSVQNMAGSTFSCDHQEIYDISQTPIVIRGLLNTPVIIMDNYIRIGSKTFSKAHLPQLTNVLAVYSSKLTA